MRATLDATEAGGLLSRGARGLVIVCAVATPVLLGWLGVHLLALHLESLQPDGDLEAGGNFAIGVLLVELVFLNYVGSGLLLWASSRWTGWNPLRALLIVTFASLTITVTVVALNWNTPGH